jgi:hypothetical protein
MNTSQKLRYYKGISLWGAAAADRLPVYHPTMLYMIYAYLKGVKR